MNIEALACVRCGGALARPAGLPALVDCLFCGTVISLSSSAAVESREATLDEQRRGSRARFAAALAAALAAGVPAYQALRDASAAHLGVAGQGDTVARIALALARDFTTEVGVAVAQDPTVLARIAEGYLRALADLRTADQVDIHLPFIAATPSGPQHFRRTVTAPLLAELARRDPTDEAPAGAATPKPKRGWWPFGR